MACVVTESCIQCRYGDCVSVCPVQAFHAGPSSVVINPNACVNCTTCVIVCPVGAIVPEIDLTPEQRPFAEKNARLAREWPRVTGPVAPFPDADRWAMKANKGHLLE